MQNVLLSWVRRDLTSTASGGEGIKQSVQSESMTAAANSAKEHVIQCNTLGKIGALMILFPPLLSTFFGDKVRAHCDPCNKRVCFGMVYWYMLKVFCTLQVKPKKSCVRDVHYASCPCSDCNTDFL